MALEVSRQAFYDYLERKDEPWKYQPLADAMMIIHAEDECNADYGRVRMYQALTYRQETGAFKDIHVLVCCIEFVYKINIFRICLSEVIESFASVLNKLIIKVG